MRNKINELPPGVKKLIKKSTYVKESGCNNKNKQTTYKYKMNACFKNNNILLMEDAVCDYGFLEDEL